MLFLLLAAIGFFISLYAALTERKVSEDQNYKAACDLTDTISCTKPMKSEYAHLFYISNSFTGMIYYATLAVLAYFHIPLLVMIMAIGGALFSCFLAYLLYFKIKALCLVCTSLYIINFLLLLLAIKNFYA
ncbi:MAG TPA: vitamin K epoxide reductase family protein [Candidatus Babeliales bacterium]|nr:vitamin K epoxide reductase family protein [Candidatus Babeliales bacterium]